jgi:hypothetical protein
VKLTGQPDHQRNAHDGVPGIPAGVKNRSMER